MSEESRTLEARRLVASARRLRRAFRAALLAVGLALVVPTLGMGLAVGQGSHNVRGGTIGIRNEVERQLFSSLICMCGCPRETLGTCTCDYASERRDELRSAIDAGLTIEAIQKSYVKRFGTQALAVPPSEGANALIWILPLVLLAGGAVLAVRILRGWAARGASQAASREAAARTSTGPAVRDAYDDKLDDELRELDRE
jgi:cytochrome c-type biogenesis protein CcmH